MYNDFMNLEMLATFAGLVAAVTLMVQSSKSLIKNKFGDAAVRVYTFVIALVLTFVFARAGTGLEGILLTVINAIIISVASMGGYEVIMDPKAEKQMVDKSK